MEEELTHVSITRKILGNVLYIPKEVSMNLRTSEKKVLFRLVPSYKRLELIPSDNIRIKDALELTGYKRNVKTPEGKYYVLWDEFGRLLSLTKEVLIIIDQKKDESWEFFYDFNNNKIVYSKVDTVSPINSKPVGSSAPILEKEDSHLEEEYEEKNGSNDVSETAWV